MSYGQPCRRMTGGPLAGPASAYPTFRSPASICFSEANDVFVPGLIGLILTGCASAEPSIASSAAATVSTAVPKRRRRSWLIFSAILTSPSSSAKQPEARAKLFRKGLRLLPGREVPAFREPVVGGDLLVEDHCRSPLLVRVEDV